MSRFLSFESDPVDQPAATDPVEAASWSALQIRAATRCVSQIWDRALRGERQHLYLPVFSLADWLVRNWWAVFYEGCRWERVPRSARTAEQFGWMQRHGLRCADPTLALPSLYLFHDGQGLHADWQADSHDAESGSPLCFLSSGDESLDSDLTQAALRSFIEKTLARLAGLGGSVDQLRQHWQAIQSATADETEYCILAARLGLDPYDPEAITPELASFLERGLGRAEDPVVRDLTEVATGESIVALWNWVSQARQKSGLSAHPAGNRLTLPSRTLSPPLFGYRLARAVRQQSLGEDWGRLDDLESVGEKILGCPLRSEQWNHIPGSGIRAIVGRTAQAFAVVGPIPPRPDSQRFLAARALFHGIASTGVGPRLVTNAYSWDQKASRAFAAELLAPQQALIDRVPAGEIDAGVIESLSDEFLVSQRVVRNQLENAGLPIAEE